MLQYLINASIIWLVALLAYEILFRKETFHQVNRIYLLLSLAAGLILPVTKTSEVLSEKDSFITQPINKIQEVKYRIETKITQTKTVAPIKNTSGFEVNFELLLWSIYGTGIVIGLFLISREGRQLYSLYKNGKKTFEHKCTVVETGKAHPPFSFFKIIFVSQKENYDVAEWELVITHEKEHSCQLHSLDNLFLIALRLVLWFHPLPHIYFKKMRMLHEFQADNAAAANTHEYGNFLLEQSLQRSSFLTHSFNYSPIKYRIMMLTKNKSNQSRLLKYSAVFPITMLMVFCCTKISFSEEIKMADNKLYFKGNELEFGKLKLIPFSYREEFQRQKNMFMHASLPDSVPVKDWKTGYIKMETVTYDMMPVAINGKPVFGNESKYALPESDMTYIEPSFGEPKNFEEYLFSKLQKELNQLEDGTYNFNISRVVIDERGKIAYYETKGINQYQPYEPKRAINKTVKTAIETRIIEVLNAPVTYTPASKDGKAINVRLTTGNYEIVVKNHKAKFVERQGC